MAKLSRHDFSKDQRDLLNRAVEIGFIDAVELGVLMANLGSNFTEIQVELTEAAFSNSHCEPQLHKDWCVSLDAFLAKQRAA